MGCHPVTNDKDTYHQQIGVGYDANGDIQVVGIEYMKGLYDIGDYPDGGNYQEAEGYSSNESLFAFPEGRHPLGKHQGHHRVNDTGGNNEITGNTVIISQQT